MLAGATDVLKTVNDYLQMLDEIGASALTATLSPMLVQLVREVRSHDATPSEFRAADADVSSLLVHPLVARVPGTTTVSIGRGSAADVTIALERLSKVHASLAARSDGGIDVVDAGSKNGSFVGDSRLEAGVRVSVHSGGVVSFGPYPFRFFSAAGFVGWLTRLREAEERARTILDPPSRVAPFDVIGHLGRGGMADVVLAHRRGPDGAQHKVAVKRLLKDLAMQPHFVDMFLQEAKNAARVQHENVVQIIDVGWEGETPFIAMEFVDGWDLSTIEKAARAANVAIPVDVACRIAVDVCHGLSAAHRSIDDDGKPLHIVHRDVSPHNVLVGRDGHSRLSDFGISKAADSVRHTKTGELRGKIAYLAPEQLLHSLGTTDERADIFALATTIYESLAGRPLFRRSNEIDTMEAVLHDVIPDLGLLRADVPAFVSEALLCCLTRRPDERTRDVVELRDALARAAGTRTVVAAWLEALGQMRTESRLAAGTPGIDVKTVVVKR